MKHKIRISLLQLKTIRKTLGKDVDPLIGDFLKRGVAFVGIELNDKEKPTWIRILFRV